MTATLTAGTYQGKTAEQWRAEGRRDIEAERESFERCDTDGFMSQWAHQIGARENEYKAQLAERGAWTEVCALFDLDGNLIDALHGWGQYGEYFMILDADGNKDATRGRNGFFSPSQARSEATARRNNAAKGFYVGTAKVPAVVDIRGGSITSVTAGIFPAEKTITAANIIEIVDNGHDTPEAAPAPAEQEAPMPQTENTPEDLDARMSSDGEVMLFGDDEDATGLDAPFTPTTTYAEAEEQSTADAPAEPAVLTVDIPGAFTEWFEGSGVMQDTDDKLDDPSRALRQAYNNARTIKRGRSFTVRLSTTDPYALWVLAEYADTVVQGGADADYTPSEIRAARAVIERVQAALQPVYDALYPVGAQVAVEALDIVGTVDRVTVDLANNRVVIGVKGSDGSYHRFGDGLVTLQPAEA